MEDSAGDKLRLGNYYRIKVKNEEMVKNLRQDQLEDTFAHNKRVRFTKELPDFRGVPQGQFKLEDGSLITLSSYDVTFKWCSDEVCSVSGGRSRRRRSRRYKRSRRVAY
jgi:hypothetical protein